MTTSANRLTQPLPGTRAAVLPLIGGPLCLNFTNTAHGRGTPDHTDNLVDYPALIAWSRHAEAIDADGAETLLATAERHPRAAEAVRRRSIELRERLHRSFLALQRGAKPEAADLAGINDELTHAMPHARLKPDAGGFTWAWDDEPALDRILWPIVRSATQLLTAPELPRVKECAGRGCSWLFLDTSKNGSRRWCEMEVCGSRAKARTYYARRKAEERQR
ncbi:MAG TPA: CGNR zinc finger domain-containing protein [Stellaceae bacterium]|nr:CGNR zinc finger domain-containing protein [Stellaceae bacterium]